MNIIETKNLTKNYGEFTAVDDVLFEVKKWGAKKTNSEKTIDCYEYNCGGNNYHHYLVSLDIIAVNLHSLALKGVSGFFIWFASPKVMN